MSLVLLSFGAGVLTVLSPCVLPVLPFVLARPGSHRLLGGLGLGFGLVMLLAVSGAGWATEAHEFGRSGALVLLGLFGLALAWPRLAELMFRPLQQLAPWLDARGQTSRAADWLLGLSTGLLWAPCAGPVLGLVLTGAALHAEGADTIGPLLAYAAGAALMLVLVRRAIARTGQRLPAAWRAVMPWAGATGRIAGGAVLAGVLLVASGWDTRLAATVPGFGLERLEQRWLDRFQPQERLEPVRPAADLAAQRSVDPSPDRAADIPALPRTVWSAPSDMAAMTATASIRPVALDVPAPLPVLGPMPSLDGATAWLQSAPLRAQDLRGKVVLVDFWTFGCVNCQRAIPSVRRWAQQYRDAGLVVIGVHAPEFPYERDRRQVERALRRLDLDFPNAMDNNFTIWKASSNQYWPTLYLVDAQGRVRWQHIGEGAYAETEQAIRQLLDEAHRPAAPSGT